MRAVEDGEVGSAVLHESVVGAGVISCALNHAHVALLGEAIVRLLSRVRSIVIVAHRITRRGRQVREVVEVSRAFHPQTKPNLGLVISHVALVQAEAGCG